MSNLRLFSFYGRNLRVQDNKGEPWFIAKDVTDILGFSDASQATRYLNADERTTLLINQDGSNYKSKQVLINESGLYSLILRSNKPEAKKFKKWVTSEVLPSIRKTGSYSLQDFSEREFLAKAVLMSDKIIQALKPKALVYDKMISAENLQSMNEAAKAIGTGRKRLFAALRKNYILMSNNLPYQKFIDEGYFQVKEIENNNKNFATTFVTSKGLAFVYKAFWEKPLSLSPVRTKPPVSSGLDG